jgi:hypothetical protein
MLNDYHSQFLTHFNRLEVRYLVIGGQARNYYMGTATKDLDLWVTTECPFRHILERALLEWIKQYPLHSIYIRDPPLPLKEGLQIKLPDADAWFINSSGEGQKISVEDGIDILTSIEGLSFEECHSRATAGILNQIPSRIISSVDLEKSQSVANRIRCKHDHVSVSPDHVIK